MFQPAVAYVRRATAGGPENTISAPSTPANDVQVFSPASGGATVDLLMGVSNDITIIGMSCRVAGADSPSKLWELLASSKDVQTEITRFNSAGFYKSTGGQRKGLTNVRHAYFIDEGIDRFDHGFFSIPPLEASAMDPQQRLLLEIAYEAIESAGILLEDMKGTDTAVYTGIFTNDYGTSLLRDLDSTPKYHSTGTSNSIAANRLSYFFDLHGPSLALDTACSSTMVALHQAVLGLKAKEAGMALVCGANLIINPDMFVHMSELGFLSPSGRCQSFDASGDGYGRGEGVLAVLLKPLDQALEHGDPIRAVIRGTRINQDGRTQGITLPSSEAQTKNLEALYKDYDLCPGDVQYLEAHGTGTAVGDPLELSAIESMFAESHKAHKLVVGSIKSNIGHLEACAALAGIIKTVECLERGQITPQMHFVNPNPKINFQTMTIPTTTMSWPPIGDGVRRAAVNSFGFGGTNGHVVLDHFRAKSGSLQPVDRPFLFKVSAANESSLEALSTSYADYVESRKPSLVNLSHTLLARRSTLKKSLFLTASNHTELVEKLRTWEGGSSKALTRRTLSAPTIGFIFTGQSAQWAEMGKQLVETSKLFGAIIGECDRVLMTLPEKPAWNIREEMLKPPKVSRINISSFSQPICTALQIGLVELWKSWGVTPHAVVGHSSGEIGAAYAAGLLSLRDAMIIAFHRGLHMGSDSKTISPGLKGAMCAVGIAESECKEFLDSYRGRIALAAVNSPSSCTLSGDEDAIKEIVTSCKEEGIFCRALRVDMAYHSHHMLPLAPRYEQSMRVAGIAPLASSVDSGCEMFSSVTQNKLSPSECSPEYWGKNMTSTVRFTGALTEAVRCHDLGAIVEIGPHPALKGPAMDTLAALGKTEVCYFGSCFRGKPDLVSLLDTVGEMINAGLPVVCSNVNGLETISGLDIQHETGQVLTDLPKYHWDHSVSHWAETRVSRNQRFREFPRHQLLGARCSNDNSLSMSWRNLLMPKEIEWLEEMMTARETHLPASAFILMALEAIRQLQTIKDMQTASIRLTDILFLEELPLSTLASEDAVIETLFNLRRVEKTEEYTFEVSATTFQPGSDWTKYCSGRINFAAAKTDRPTWEEESVIHNAAQLDYIESFKIFPQLKLDTLRLNGDRANGRFTDSSDDDEHYHLSPVLFASLTQIPHMLLLGSGLPAAYQLESIDCLEVPMGAWKFHNGDFNVDLTRLGPTRGKTDVQIYDTSGNYMYFRGMRSKLHQLIHRTPPLQSLFYEPQLRPDITYLESSSPLPVSHVIELVTHKWPMSDIGIIDLSSEDSDTIRSQLQGIKEHERPRFRSLNVVSDEPVSDSGRVRTVKSFGTDQKLHLLFSSAQTLHSPASHVQRTGVACIRIQNSHDRALFDLSFDLICEVEGFQSSGWLLGRPKALENGVLPLQRLRVFATRAIDIPTLREYADFEYTQLDKQTIHTICDEQTQLRESFDLIVMDCEKESMLVTWAGNDLLPWIQSVLERVRNLLWVSIQTSASPFSNVAGSFVRTIRSEHPSMRATSLVFKDTFDLQFINKSIFDVYNDMVHGSNEVELIAKGLQVCALRYQPDDELSASVGLVGSHTSGKSLSSSSYEVSLAAPGRAVLLSDRFDSTGTPVCGNVYVAIEASVVDHFDAVLFTDTHSGQYLWKGLGQFFAGRVVSDGDPICPPNTFVVGWHVGAHKSKVHVSTSQLRSVSENISSAEAAAHYAAFSIASAVVHGTARARRSEVLSIHLSGLLAEALTVVCHSLGVIPDLGSRKEADFVVTFDNFHGLLLNGQNVSVEKFMLSDLQQGYMSKYLAEDLPLRSPTFTFALGDFQKAFQTAKMNPISTVLIHTGLGGIHGDMVRYKSPERLFREDAAYVILGGLGGLGRYISTWMVANGAKHLVTLSRSGLTSEDAWHTVKTIQDLGAQIQVFQADAGDVKAVDEALAEVRKVRRIRGCLNMVMVLDNSPFMTMKPTQWDRALRTKVDSTWNMHQATLRDDLDIFIMFSSISSISGNRTQANCATGNAFQNAMAEYRKSLGLPGIAIALGAMSGIGVLANDHDLLRTLSQSGLQHLGPKDLTKIMEAAVFESQHSDRSLLSVGFEMFETLDDKVQSKPEQNQLFWTESPEFGFLLDHKFSSTAARKTMSVREKLQIQEGEAAHHTVLQAFLLCLGNVLGYDVATFDPASSLASYGLDSLNAVSCRYWFFKQLEIDVPVFDILGCRSINELISRVLQRLRAQSGPEKAVNVPQPVHYDEQSLHVRPISHSQSRLWFLNEFLPDKTVYNLLLVCHISGTVKVPLFAKAWSVFIQRHEVLHSKIVDTVDGLQQVPIRNAFFPLTEVEASEMTFQSQVKTITEAAKAYKFNLGTGELVHGWLLKSPVGWRFFLASHHLAWDRTSVPTIFDETTAIYRALVNGEDAEATISPVPYQFIDYTLWQENWLNKQHIVQPLVDYWKSQLAGTPEAVSLFPTALTAKRPIMKQYAVNSMPLHLESSLTSALKAFCKKSAVTPFMFLASAVSALVHRLTGDNDIVIGIADGDRGHTEFDRLVGFTVNMLAIRSKISKDMPYINLLEDYRKACLEAYEHRAIPFDFLLQQLEVTRRTSHSPIFQITVNYQMQGSFPECDYGDFKFTQYDHYNARSQSDFRLDIEETAAGELHCVFDFDTALYDKAAMLNLANTFKVLIENILATNGLARVDSINLIPTADQEFISSILQPSFGMEPSLKELDRSLFPVLFSNAVAAFPTKLAVIDDARYLTYRELSIATNRVANFLIGQGARIGDRIGICCEQGIDMIVAMYGIVKAGCVYVPIDPDFPEERMLSMIEDVELETVLVDSFSDKVYEQLITCGITVSHIHTINVLATTGGDARPPNLSRELDNSDAFCCIFTSGSTGRPKGIYLGHRQLRYQMEGYHNCIDTVSEDRILLSSAMVFDMSLTAIFGTILHGATMLIASREARYSPSIMVDQLVERQISNCTFTTTQLKILLTAPNKTKLFRWTSLRSMVVGGEQIPPWVVRDFYNLGLPHACVFNGYAPSETTVCNSLRKLLPEDAKRQDIPLERPLFPTRFYILDESFNPVPIGMPGELYIGGPTVNEGYVKREAITAKAFLRDPFASVAEIEDGNGKLYRSGDSFRLMRDGTIQALGRIGGDRQVKIRGMRTELDEIENAIWDACQAVEDPEACPVSLVAVAYYKTGDVDGVLAAYLATTEVAESNTAQRRSLKAYILLRLKATLPVHMIPSSFVFLPNIPRTVTGKTDYKTILTWSTPVPDVGTVNGDSFEGLQLNKLQSIIASIWKEVLHIDGDLTPWDEFFALGGHSLVLLHVQMEIKEQCCVTLSLGDMFANPTIQGMESLILTHPDYQSVTNRHMMKINGISVNGSSTSRDQTFKLQATSAFREASAFGTDLMKETLIEWEKEGSLPEEFDWFCDTTSFRPASVIAITGACTMAGAHFLHHILLTTNINVYCIGTEASDDEEARSLVLSTLKLWRLFEDIPSAALNRMEVYKGSLSHPTLDLTRDQVSKLDKEVNAIYQLDSEVSLLKRYENLRASNVGSLQFLISLAHGNVSNTKAIHYLSTWGVPHLQAWNQTELTSPHWLTDEVEMTNMKPGADGTLGYLKCRWACESMLYQAARRGIPVTIFRSCMCAGSHGSGVALARTDINRRILEGSLQTGLVPDFGSERGGGMSWITADFLVESILFLSQRYAGPRGQAKIYHVVSDTHVPYKELARLLDVSHGGENLRVVRPEEWFEALRAKGNPEMTMQAEVLEKWCEAGWVPFGLEAKETLQLLKKEAGLVPPKVERDMLLKLAVGERGF